MPEENNNWTLYTLKTFLMALIEANDKRYEQNDKSTKVAMDAALAAADRAVAKAEVANEKRFDSVNEFRGMVNEQQRVLMPRAEVELLVKIINEKIDANANALSTISAQKSGRADMWAYLIGGIGVLSLAVSVILHFI